MAQTASNVRVAVDGVIWTAPAGTTAPAAPSITSGVLTALATPWVDLGYANDSGIERAANVETETINAWPRGDVVREVVTSAEEEFTLTLIEQTKSVVELVFETTVGVDGSWVVNPGVLRTARSYVFDVLDGDKALRIYIPQGVISPEVENEVFNVTDPLGYGIAIKTRYSDAIAGHSKRWWTHLATSGS